MISTGFTSLLNWSGRLGKCDRGIANKSLGLAFYAVYDWKNCIRCWETEALSLDATVLSFLHLALLYQLEYARAVQCFISISNHVHDLQCISLFHELLQIGSGKGFLNPFLQYTLEPSNRWYQGFRWDDLESALLKWGNSDTAILALENFVAWNSSEDIAYYRSLYRAYKRGRGSGPAIRRLQEIAHAEPQNVKILGVLAEAYTDQANYD